MKKLALMGLILMTAGAAHAAEPKAVERARAYLDRIRTEDPAIRSVLWINPQALSEASAADRRSGSRAPSLNGIPLLVKDNIDVAGLPNTAGSLALKDNVPAVDAPVIARLRAAGVVILGKSNLSEWANIRSSDSLSGWSGLGGQTRNPYDKARSPCGSSAGSGAAMAAGLASCSAGTSTATVDQLDGTTWCSPQTHTRVSVDRLGAVSTKEGKDLCLAFTGQDGSYVVRIVWWNLSKGI
ncbi:MAG: hypothetical protein EBS42_09700, partial [Caulobacteraceae bacterium]|nr:hypothetical protein [Caulobacteraceae bacterium]